MSETDDTNGSSDPAEKERELREFYGEMTRLIERLHRRYLEVVRIQLEALGIRDINSVQALILVTVADEEMLVRDLIQRCYYLGSSTNYNIKKLVDCEYLEQQRSSHDLSDRRTTRKTHQFHLKRRGACLIISSRRMRVSVGILPRSFQEEEMTS